MPVAGPGKRNRKRK